MLLGIYVKKYSLIIFLLCACRFIECFIAEQNLVGVGIGAACRDRTVAFCSTFAAFFTRAFDQLRMGAISQVLYLLFYSMIAFLNAYIFFVFNW